jgi:histidyl-tRNA synthetase
LEQLRVQFTRPQSTLNARSQPRTAEALRAFMATYGYMLVETPLIQPAELFLTKAGDQLVTRLFTFERHNHALALRPEFTATAARDYVVHHPSSAPVVRWQFSGPIFDDDPARSDGEFQHDSIGAELIGLGGTLGEAEMIGMAAQGAAALGIANARLVIGHVGLMRLLLARFALDPRTERFILSRLDAMKDPARGKRFVLDQFDRLLGSSAVTQAIPESAVENETASAQNTQIMLDALLNASERDMAMGGRSRNDIVRRLLQKRRRASERDQVLKALDFLERWGQIDAPPSEAFTILRGLIAADDSEALDVLATWQQTIALLADAGISADQIRVQPNLARSWDYYTGIVFELYSADGLHLAGGGRYDELLRLVGGRDEVPAVGFVYYPDNLLAAAPPSPEAGAATVKLVVSAGQESAALRWAQALRHDGLTVALLPSAQAAQPLLTIDGDQLRYRDAAYSLTDLPRLVALLK